MAIRYRAHAEQEMDALKSEQEKAFARHRNIGSLQDAISKRGRPPSDNAKQLLSLRLDPEVIEFFRKTGDGWQTRINAELRKIAGLPH